MSPHNLGSLGINPTSRSKKNIASLWIGIWPGKQVILVLCSEILPISPGVCSCFPRLPALARSNGMFWFRTHQVLGPTGEPGPRDLAFPTSQMRFYIHIILETGTKVIPLFWAVQLALNKERKQISLMSLLRFPVGSLVSSFWSQLRPFP